MKSPTINTLVLPKLPFRGAETVENALMGNVRFDPKDYEFYLAEEQKTGYIKGHKLREKMEMQRPVNAAFMDYLETHPDLVPESWKKDADGRTRFIYAWGTIFRRSDDRLYVRFWYWDDGALQSLYDWLDDAWDVQSPALVLASSKKLGTGSKNLSALTLISEIEERLTKLKKLV